MPHDQFQNLPKDYYVAIRIRCIDNIYDGVVVGYARRDDLQRNRVKDFGSGPGNWLFLRELRDMRHFIKVLNSRNSVEGEKGKP